MNLVHTLPHTMHAVDLPNPGGPENMVVANVPVPDIGVEDVLIHVKAAGINRPDLLQRMGLYPPPPDADPRLGLEVAGEVAAVGDGVRDFKVGDPVLALVNGGGYAQYARAAMGQVSPVPAGLSMVQAAAIAEAYFTVWVNLFGHGGFAAGKTVLIHGGSSGIGTTAIQLAREFGAAKVIVTAGNAEKCEACVALGADAAINYREEDFVARTLELTNGRGVDVVLDMVAGSYLSRNISCLAPSGRLVVIAVQGGLHDSEFSILPVMLKRLVITGSTLRPRTVAEKPRLRRLCGAMCGRCWRPVDVCRRLTGCLLIPRWRRRMSFSRKVHLWAKLC